MIDYYLGWNPKLQAIGRLLIAWVILECESVQLRNEGNANGRETLINSPYMVDRERTKGLDPKNFKDDWCRFVIHQLAIRCESSADIFRNAVRFVTFNYDISFERALYRGLQLIEMFKPEHVKEFLDKNRVMHVYGKVRENPFEQPPELKWSEQSRDPKDLQSPPLAQHLLEYKVFLDELYAASQGIHVIDPADKETNKDTIKKAIDEIDPTKYVYILGYGFDENNSDRLDLPRLLHYERAKEKYVFFTNFGDINRVTKRASKIFFGRSNQFAPGVLVESGGSNRYERSFRNVYEALELDFDQFD